MSSESADRGRGHGPICEATIEVFDDVLEAEQCESCELKVPTSGDGSDGFETYRCGHVERFSAPKLRTSEDRNSDFDSFAEGSDE